MAAPGGSAALAGSLRETRRRRWRWRWRWRRRRGPPAPAVSARPGWGPRGARAGAGGGGDREGGREGRGGRGRRACASHEAGGARRGSASGPSERGWEPSAGPAPVPCPPPPASAPARRAPALAGRLATARPSLGGGPRPLPARGARGAARRGAAGRGAAGRADPPPAAAAPNCELGVLAESPLLSTPAPSREHGDKEGRAESRKTPPRENKCLLELPGRVL
nr:translation initiation factor IF-2 [Oryctolagus cuniculus]